MYFYFLLFPLCTTRFSLMFILINIPSNTISGNNSFVPLLQES